MKNHHSLTNRLGIKRGVSSLFLILFFAFAAFGQTPPPNDNYSNSITLTGTDITFSGTLAGATLEDSQETSAYNTYNGYYYTPSQSVWWNWTAPTDTVLTLQILNPVPPFPFPSASSPLLEDEIIVYSATNGSLTPAGLVLPELGLRAEINSLALQTLSIPVTGGSNYQIQLIGNSSYSHNLHLVATNTPVIITQPRSQTVYSNASALFYIVYAGLDQTTFTFQWHLNGTNLPGETAPMLALNHIDSSMAGSYTVAVSNAAGATISVPATLTISQPDFPVSLAATGTSSNSFTFSVAGELGRSYMLQSSTNLVDWMPETNFAMDPYFSRLDTSVFFDTNMLQFLTASDGPPAKYFRVTPYVTGSPDAEICINNLRQIRIAKLLWQRSVNATADSIPQPSDLTVYFPHQTLPSCPDDEFGMFETSYSISSLLTPPSCYINPTNHVLTDPQ